MTPITLTCICCGTTATFTDAEAAFRAGWDAPPHFTHICCHLCPAVAAVGIVGHTRAHADWTANGRPADFDHRCITDDLWPMTADRYGEFMTKEVEPAAKIAAAKFLKTPGGHS